MEKLSDIKYDEGNIAIDTDGQIGTGALEISDSINVRVPASGR